MQSSRFYTIPLVILGIVSFLLLSFALFNIERPFEPMSEIKIVKILNRVPSVDGPAVYLGDLVDATGTRCVVNSSPIVISGETDLVLVGDNGPSKNWYLSGSTAIFDPGCITRTYSNRLPAGLNPGQYRIQGYFTTKNTGIAGQIQAITWKTEEFKLMLR